MIHGKKYIRHIIFILVMCVCMFSAFVTPEPYAQNKEEPAFYTTYESVLKEYVDSYGMVNYRGLKQKRTALDDFTDTLGRLKPGEFDTWSEKEKIAFWINAYNALTLKVIIDNYPIKASLLSGLMYPKNSIRQISGVWDKKKFTVLGQKMTLDHIEHEILRTQFNEPRIHMALVCAALSCPPLRNEPFVGNTLDDQLDDQTGRFLEHPKKFTLNKQRKRLYLSSIFKWFGKDFIRSFGTNTAFDNLDEPEKAVLSFINPFINSSDREFILSEKFTVSYVDYDWSLNEKK